MNETMQIYPGPVFVDAAALKKLFLSHPFQGDTVHAPRKWSAWVNTDSETMGRSVPVENNVMMHPAWLSNLKREIQDIRDMNPSWGESAFSLADMVMLELGAMSLKPDRVIPSSEDGVSFYFFTSRGYALIECLASKEMTALIKEENSETSDVWEVSADLEEIRRAAIRIRDFTTLISHEHTPATTTLA